MVDPIKEQRLDIVRNHIENSEPAIPVIPLAEKLGITIHQKNWPRILCSKIQLHKDGGTSGYAIFINENLDRATQRFSIAYQIAHFVLHERAIQYGHFDHARFASNMPSEMEADANLFAANIIMPWRYLRLDTADGTYNIKQLATRYNTTPKLIANRLKISDP